MKVGVVVPVLINFQIALEALASVKTQFDWQPYIQANWLNNRGVSGAWNDGIQAAFDDGCTYVLVINDDVVLSRWTIDNQIKVLEEKRDELFVLTTGWSTTPPIPESPLSMMDYGEPPTEAAWIPGADFACFMLNRLCWEEVGKFDENFFPAYFEDNDYHRRLLLRGFQARIVPQAPYYHYGSMTQNTNHGVNHHQFQINQGYYQTKWGGGPGAEIYANPYNIPDAPISYIRY